MYENGGNTTHRFFDGHPELFVYPFESQLGNSNVQDYLSSLYPFKYRYPDFPSSGRPEDDYELFFDEELKTYLRARRVSKFRDVEMDLDEAERKRLFCEAAKRLPRTRANLVAAFFEATFSAWKDFRRTGREVGYVGYSPVIGFDGETILSDFPRGNIVHVVRNPWSGYADTIKRPFPLSLQRYAWTWSLMQHFALTFAKRHGERFIIIRFEDLVADSKKIMADLVEKLGLSWSETLLYPSWNGRRMDQVYPWGTIHTPTSAANTATMNELSAAQKADIKAYCSVMLPYFGYEELA
jgi:hypothetical protein